VTPHQGEKEQENSESEKKAANAKEQNEGDGPGPEEAVYLGDGRAEILVMELLESPSRKQREISPHGSRFGRSLSCEPGANRLSERLTRGQASG
jgi:hypothetical protein